MHRFDQAHLTARLDDCFDCSHLDAQSNTPGSIRKEESTTMIAQLTIPLEREINGNVALAPDRAGRTALGRRLPRTGGV